MGNLLNELIPQSRKGLALWFILFVAFFGGYYFLGPYSSFEKWYAGMHYDDLSPTANQEVVPSGTAAPKIIRISVPDYVADFMETTIVVVLKNPMTSTIPSAVVGLEIEDKRCRDQDCENPPRIEIRSPHEELSQTMVALKDIPPYAEMRVEFLVRIICEDCDSYKVDFTVNERVVLDNVHAMTFDRYKRFQMWIVSLFLLPPGMHIVIPVLSLLFASWIESFCSVLKRKQICKLSRYGRCSIETSVVILILVLSLVLGGGWGFTFALMAAIVFFILKWRADEVRSWLVMMLLIALVLAIALPQELRGTWHIICLFVGGTLICFCPWVYDFMGESGGAILVLKKDLCKGTVLAEDDLKKVNPDEISFLPAEKIDQVVGKKLKRDVDADNPILESDL